MTKNDDKCVPALRFKGFNNDWAQHKLGDIAQRKNKTSDCSKLPNVSYEDISPNIGTLNKSVNKLSTGKKGILFKKDDVLFGKLRPYLNNYLFADFTGIAIGDFWVLNHKEAPQFLFYLIQSPKFRYISNISSGSKMPRSDWNLVSNYKFNVPAVFEQTNIGKTLKLIDTLITLQQRKLKQVELLKKYLLQNLFPTKNEKNAKLLFKGHKEIWREQKANDIFTEVDTRKVPDNTILSTTQNGKVVPRNSLGRNLVFSTSKLKNYKLVRSGQFIIHLRSFKGGFATSSLTGIVSPTYTIFDFKNRTKHDTKFWSILFTNYNFIQSLKSVTEGIRYNGIAIKFSQFSDLKISFPQLSTQMDISKIINCLNLSLEKQKLKIQKLQKTKQFLLQNMFI